MPPRDVPDVSNILHTKRGRKRPRPADQEHSLAPNAGSTNAGQGLSSSDSQDPVDQRLPSSSTPVTIPSTPSAVVIQGPSITTTAISGLGTMEHEEFSPTGSIVPLISETPATHQSDRGQETTTNVLNYFTTALWNQPAHQEVVGLFNPREHHETENEEVYLIDEEIEPTEQIIAHLLSLRDSPEDDVQEDADIVYTSEIDDQPEYPSESEFEGIGSIDVHLPALPVQPQRAVLSQVLQAQRAEAEIRAAAAERRQAVAASAMEDSRSTTEASRLSGSPLEPVIALSHVTAPHPLAPAGTRVIFQAHLGHPIVPTFDGVRAVLHNRLGALLEVIVIVKDNPYGSAYRSIRYCLIMESACALLGFKLGHRKDQPITIGDQSVIQADVIQYLGIGQGRTFWNFRAVHHLAVKARDFVERLSCGTRQGHQTETLNIITHMLDASLLALPCEAGSASAATTISKPDFEAKCYQALGMQAKGK